MAARSRVGGVACGDVGDGSAVAVADLSAGLVGLVSSLPSIRRVRSHSAARFLIAGLFASAVNWSARFPLSWALPFEAAVAASYGVGMLVGFVLYRFWVFPRSPTKLSDQVWRFVAVNAGGMLVVVASSVVFTPVLSRALPLKSWIIEAATHGFSIMIGAVFNYFGHRFLTFARRATSSRRSRASIAKGDA